MGVDLFPASSRATTIIYFLHRDFTNRISSITVSIVSIIALINAIVFAFSLASTSALIVIIIVSNVILKSLKIAKKTKSY